MATIDLSPGFITGGNGYISRMHRLGSHGGNGQLNTVLSRASVCGILNSPGTSQAVTGTVFFYIMQGIVPTDFSTLTSASARSADVLLTFRTGMNADGDFAPTNDISNPSIISTNYIPATGTGTATWFWWTLRPWDQEATSTTNPLVNQIIGTVGTVGSGADLELADINIVAGSAYRILNLRLSWPTTWTY